ncbi:alpha/beta hydrolase [Paraburkholderia sp. DHOC27]|uniref:alpha/beta hydrolase n=1 Tax=Paraburkholderia sp. DHOC27 TaxID=2303330 RepID=UPI000E3BDFBE|nr:alpha/beta hydrolase [Paraburkholderia sp. DHOC27]RFU47035.1 alpha/beta hydrolase [Paraburkholderia sp. DHOC27]
MSWQSTLACWYLRRQFRPATLKPEIDVESARYLTARRAWVPKVPAGWRLREQYATGDAMRGEWLEPLDADSNSSATSAARAPVILYLHGGGYYFCSPKSHRSLVFGLATRARAATFSLDYRLAPEHRFPGALDDAVAAYRHLLAGGIAPGSIVIAGDSAGGGLALATLVALRDAGDPLPAGGVLFSPWTDLAASGASIRSNDGADPMFSGPAIGRAAKVYLGDTPATHPYASPVYADLRGLPPLFIQAGSTEVLLDDSTRAAENARAVGVSVELQVWPKMPHVWQIFAPFIPEAGRALDAAAGFVGQVTAAADQPSSAMSMA